MLPGDSMDGGRKQFKGRGGKKGRKKTMKKKAQPAVAASPGVVLKCSSLSLLHKRATSHAKKKDRVYTEVTHQSIIFHNR